MNANKASKEWISKINKLSAKAIKKLAVTAKKRHALVGTQWPIYMNSGLPGTYHWHPAYSADMTTGSVVPLSQLSYLSAHDNLNEGIVRSWVYRATTSTQPPMTPPTAPFVAATLDTNYQLATGVAPGKPIAVPVSNDYMCSGTDYSTSNAVLYFQAESEDNHPAGQPVHIFISIVNVDSEATEVAVLWNGVACKPTTGGLAEDGTVTLAPGPPNALGGSVLYDTDEPFTDSCTLQIFVSNKGGADLLNHSAAVSGWVSE